MEERVWRNGEKCERSRKGENPALVQAPERVRALDQALDTKLNTEIKIKEDFAPNIGELGAASNRREDVNSKLSERQMIGQVSHNPFLTSTDYVNDLEVQENYLKPQNSNMNIKDSQE
jgi:hypothetical protein